MINSEIENYKHQTPYCIKESSDYLCIFGLIRRNKPLKNYLQNHEASLLEEPVHQLSLSLGLDLKTVMPGFHIGYSVYNKFCLFFHPSKMVWPIQRDNLNSLVASRAANFLSNYYSNPMILVSTYTIPREKFMEVVKHYQNVWFRDRDQILAKMYLTEVDISRPIMNQIEEQSDFKESTLPANIRNGVFYT